MDPTIAINQQVEVIALFRIGADPSKNCRPYKMRYNNRDITFNKLAYYHPTSQGKRMIHIFDMSDGSSDYRLEFDAESFTWTLMTVIEGQL